MLGEGMTNDQRLAKLYQVQGLPFPVFLEAIYWIDRIAQMGFDITFREACAIYEGAKKNADRTPI